MMALASSMADPPPRAMRVSGLCFITSLTPSITSSRGGSGTTLLKIVQRSFSRYPVIRSTRPDSTIKGSVTINIPAPCSFFKYSNAFFPKCMDVFIPNSSIISRPFDSIPRLACVRKLPAARCAAQFAGSPAGMHFQTSSCYLLCILPRLCKKSCW